jgi:DNA modification methylase
VSVQVLTGDCRSVLATLTDCSVNCVVTSPPYFGLRDYGVDGQIGLEDTPDAFVAELVSVFREVRRVLRDDGTLWLNLGDSYAGSWGAQSRGNTTGERSSNLGGGSMLSARQIHAHPKTTGTGSLKNTPGLKPKDLIGVPWRVAFALQADGWYLRQDIIWSKPNPMPESVQDRCTKAHEYVFLLSKSPRYYYDQDAIAEPVAPASVVCLAQDVESQQGSARVPGKTNGAMKAVGRASGNKSHKYVDQYEADDSEEHRTKAGLMKIAATAYETRNARSVWNIATQPFSEAHFATFPPELAERCIKAGCPEGGTVLDPFFGAGTTGLVADRLQRNAIGIELNPAYADMARNRITKDAGLFAEVASA